MLWARTALQCTCFLFTTFEDVEFSDLGAEYFAYLVRYESNLAETFVPASMSWVTDINQENSLTNSLRSQCSLIQMFTPCVKVCTVHHFCTKLALCHPLCKLSINPVLWNGLCHQDAEGRALHAMHIVA